MRADNSAFILIPTCMIEMRTVSGAIAYDSQLNYFYIFFISRTTMEGVKKILTPPPFRYIKDIKSHFSRKKFFFFRTKTGF